MSASAGAPDYLSPGVPAGLPQVDLPGVVASDAALAGYGFLVEDREHNRHEIVRWPASG